MSRKTLTREELNDRIEECFKKRKELLEQRENETDKEKRDSLTKQISTLSVRIGVYRKSPLIEKQFQKPKPLTFKLDGKPLRNAFQSIQMKAMEKIQAAMEKNDSEEVKRIQEQLDNVRLKLKYEYCI